MSVTIGGVVVGRLIGPVEFSFGGVAAPWDSSAVPSLGVVSVEAPMTVTYSAKRWQHTLDPKRPSRGWRKHVRRMKAGGVRKREL